MAERLDKRAGTMECFSAKPFFVSSVIPARLRATVCLMSMEQPLTPLKRGLRLLRRLLFCLVLLCALDIGRYLFWPPVSWLSIAEPQSTAMIRYRQDEWRKEKPGDEDLPIRRTWVPLNRISPNLHKAVVISEDDTFWEHDGFNFSTMIDALERNLKEGRLAAGGSTITQQLAKNLWFSPERSILRKIKEAIMACRLELMLDKKRILELYLNVVEWGNGIYGAEAAARHHFGKSCAGLTEYEAACLAAILPAPRSRTPSSPLVKKLANRLVRRMPQY